MDSIKKSRPFHMQIYEILKNQILMGKLISGERLYENKISQELGVSRSPVREALRMLEQDELVMVTPGGLIVNPMDYSDMEEVYQCRIATEPFAAYLAVNNLTESEIDSLKAFVEAAREFHRQKEFAKLVEANTGFHDGIIEKCGNVRLRGIIDKLRSLAILSRRAEFECYNRDNEYLLEHEKILMAIIEKDAIKAEELLKNHIINDYNFFRKQFENAQLNNY